MGFYIFDSHEVGARDKLAMLRELPGAKLLSTGPLTTRPYIKRGEYVVCWVDNGTFEAVGIVYDDKELHRFKEGMNGRSHEWFAVPIKVLVKLRPHLAEYLCGQRNWRE